MKSRSWILIFSVCILLCVITWIMISSENVSNSVGIYRNGVLIREIDLDDISEPYEITVEGETITNTIQVEKGSIYVSDSTCPDKICVDHGELKGGDPIVCLPNRLVIKYIEKTEINAVIG